MTDYINVLIYNQKEKINVLIPRRVDIKARKDCFQVVVG